MMKYVIKHDGEYISTSGMFESSPAIGFDYHFNLDSATQFNSLTEAITAIQRRISGGANSPKSFTIVGIKEVSTPRYEEVIL